MRSKQVSSFSAGGQQGVAAGTLAGIGAFGVWAVFPVYFNQFGPGVSPWDMLLHRVIWTAALLFVFILLRRRMARVLAVVRRPKTLAALAGSALAIGMNWGTFIWAVTHAEILQSSLGYYINPLVNVTLGYCFLRERLRPLQWLAVGIAAAGVLISLIGYGDVPWLALLMAVCFGFYGLIRKQVDVDGVTGLMVEALLMTPVAVAWLAAMGMQGGTFFPPAGLTNDLLLVGSGVVTIVPLLLFAFAARRLRLTTVGLLQYIAPTGHFLCGVYLYGEPFTAADAVTFGCIWTGLALYTTDMWLWHRAGFKG